MFRKNKIKSKSQIMIDLIFKESMIIHLIILTILVIIFMKMEDNSLQDGGSFSKMESKMELEESLTVKDGVKDKVKDGVKDLDIAEIKNDKIKTELVKPDEDDYLLAKIVMAEAEGGSTKLKEYIIMTILNRVEDESFPNTIKEVIFQEYKGVYQFSPIGDGRWDKVEPNEDCWKALDLVKKLDKDDMIKALYFEACSNSDNWHSRNLNLLYQIETTRFYN